MGLQCSEVVKEMIILSGANQFRCLACATLGEFPLLEKLICGGHPSSDICGREQPAILSMLCQGESVIAKLSCPVCVQRDVNILTELLVDFRILGRGLQ